MKRALQTIILILIASKLLSQNSYESAYKNDAGISDLNGEPVSKESLYFPIVEAKYVRHYLDNNGKPKWFDDAYQDLFVAEFGKNMVKDSLFFHYIDPISQRIFSKYLFEFDEPVLYNFYLNRDIIRFTFIPAFDNPVVIKLENLNDSTLLTMKVLDYRINNTVIQRAFYEDPSVIASCDNPATWVVNQQSFMDYPALDSLHMLINDLKIKSEVPFYNTVVGEDGSDWIIEIHSETGYYYNERWSPPENSSIRIIAEYLIKLSKLEEYIKY